MLGPGAGLEEVVVTAQKRKESLQKTPLSVSAVTAALIEQRGTTDVSTLSAIAPNLAVTTSPASSTNTTIFIRGIGDGDPVLTSDAPVSIYIDGVVVGRQAGAVFDLVDLERIEVLRGPQGTLYGRNTTGGAVNLITAKPADEFHLKAKLSYGSWNQWQARTSIDTGEWGESGIRAKLSYVHREQDGYVDNLNAPGNLDPGAFELDAGRVALSFDRGGAFRANYAFDYNYRRSIAPAFQMTVVDSMVLDYLNGSPALGGNGPQVSTRRLENVVFDDDGVLTDKVTGHTLTLELDLGENMLLRSLTGYREWDNIDRGDELDGQGGILGLFVDPGSFEMLGVQPVSLFTSNNVRRQHQVSQEFNLIGSLGERLEYVAGVFYFDEKSYERNPQFLNVVISPQLAVPLQALLDFDHESDSKAVFGQATYGLTDRLSLTAGVRYTEDTKKLTQRTPFPRSPPEAEYSSSRVNWAATLDYQLRDELLTYARVATGYKAGGFQARSANAGFEPEDLVSFELGMKSELLDRRLRLNGAIFYVDHEDLQIQQFQAGEGGSTSITTNAGKANYMGIEAEFEAVLAEGLTLSGSAGYIDREFDEFWIRDPETDLMEDVADTARFTFAPETTATVALQYEFPRLGPGQLTVRLEGNYQGKVHFYPTLVGTPRHEQIADDGRTLLDARATLSEISIGGGATAAIALWGRNLADEEYRVHGIDWGPLGWAGSIYGEPRSYGIDLSISF